jgi:magnesium transporter
MPSTTTTTAIVFDFAKRDEHEIPVEEARAACESGLSVWIDLDITDAKAAERILQSMGVNQTAIDEAITHPVAGRCDVYAECIHTAMAGPELKEGRITFAHANVMIGDRFLITCHGGPVEFVSMARRHYKPFFHKFAQTLGFLLFELWDHLIDSYRKGLHAIQDEVEQVQSRILGETDDRIFAYVADVTHNLLVMRRNILADRDVLHQLTMRQSSFISDSARPHLTNMVGTLDRLGSDLTVEREVLAETLNLYLGIVGHRTNRVVNRLTVLSSVFLPLTFLCGVYGMNFTYLPEKDWQFGYLYFWIVAAVIAVGLVAFMKIKRWM